MIKDRLQSLILNHGFAILDGAMGTELERRGYRTRLPFWSAKASRAAKHLLSQIHDDYVSAGADILTANTFRTTAYTLASAQSSWQASDLTQRAVDIAKQSAHRADRDILVAGSLAPLEDCYSPDLVPSKEIVQVEYANQIQLLAEYGVDFVLIETMINHIEAVIAAEYCHSTAVPFMLSFSTQRGALLDGTDLTEMIQTVNQFDPLALLLNCRPLDVITSDLSVLRQAFDGIVGAYGNGPGQPDPHVGWAVEEGGVDVYADAALSWFNMGARIIGGCCGTTPLHIGELAALRSRLTNTFS